MPGGEDVLKGTRLRSQVGTIARKPVLLLTAVLAVALALRLLHLYAVSQTALVDFHRIPNSWDIHTTWVWAEQIAAGDWLGQPPYNIYNEWMKRKIARIDGKVPPFDLTLIYSE